MHICFKIIKFLLHSTLLYVFRTLLCPSAGTFHHCTCSLWLPCGVVFVASSSPVLLLLRLLFYDFKTDVHLVRFYSILWLMMHGTMNVKLKKQLGMPRYPLYRRLGKPQGRSGQVRKFSLPTEFHPRTVQLVAIPSELSRPTNFHIWWEEIARGWGM
jgi:hypothetical protein